VRDLAYDSRVKVLRVVGARPQFMQVPIFQKKLLEAGHEHILLHTGQHFDFQMNEVFFSELGIHPPEVNLGLGGLDHAKMVGRIIEGVAFSINRIKPDIVVVDGDTNSTLAAAIAANKTGTKLIHIEAGIRDFDLSRPEEYNRKLTDHLSQLNCAPIPRALQNLKLEGLEKSSSLTGDLLLDTFQKYYSQPTLENLVDNIDEEFALCTLHRPENTDLIHYEKFLRIMDYLESLKIRIFLPLHPRSQEIFFKFATEKKKPRNIQTIEPVGYLKMLALLKKSKLVITDSGGLSREATWAGKPTLMIFEVETWHDLVQGKLAAMVNLDASISETLDKISPNPEAARELFGSGLASERIIASMEKLC
jgi:UDP-GlcNAc3NAcA epimerase